MTTLRDVSCGRKMPRKPLESLEVTNIYRSQINVARVSEEPLGPFCSFNILRTIERCCANDGHVTDLCSANTPSTPMPSTWKRGCVKMFNETKLKWPEPDVGRIGAGQYSTFWCCNQTS